MQQCHNQEEGDTASVMVTDSDQRDPTDESEQSPPKKQRTLGSWLGRKSTQGPVQEEAPLRIRLSQEMDLYAAMPSIGADKDPLNWWKEHMKDFKLMAPFAKKYLAIQATSSPSERLFSKAGNIITPKRAQLNPEKANMLVFLAQNL